MEYVKLNNGVEMPVMGLGTYMISPKDAEITTCEALKMGYRMIEKAYKEGKVKAIGISNCEGEYIENILANCEIKPQVIQVEAHPYFTQDELRKILDKEDIKLMSWYPLGHEDTNLMNEKVFEQLGEKYGKSKVQIILRWHIDMGFIVIPGTSKVEHVKENFNILDFKLTKEDMAEISKINKNERYYIRTEEALQQFAMWQPEYEKEGGNNDNI